MARATFTTTPANLGAALQSQLLSRGWITLATNAKWQCPTPTGTSEQLTLNLVSSVAGYAAVTFYVSSHVTQSPSVYLYTGGTSSSQNLYCKLFVSQASDPFPYCFLRIQGPNPGETGAANASNGSSSGYAFAYPQVPYLPGDTVAKTITVGGSSLNSSGSPLNYAYVSQGLMGGNWATGHFLTMRPAIEDSSNLWQRPWSRLTSASETFWPYVFVEQTAGVRGRLDGLFFVADNAVGTLDAATYETGVVSIAGVEHSKFHAGANINTSNLSSTLGQMGPQAAPSNSALGGPIIAVRG